MGRKMKATKSGKFINPTDRERKEARKRELRKNKKQRLIVRTAVLKGKDPFTIIADLERLDKMEFDFNNQTSLNEKVLKDKRRKLTEMWDRICRLYVKEDKDKFLEMKRIEAEYEAKRNELMKQFEAVKSAQEVSVDDIPLPALPMEAAPSASSESTSSSILKSAQRNKIPPGCPQGLPPTLSEFEVAGDSDDSDDESLATKKIRFSDEAPTKDKESIKENLKDFLKEIEQLTGDKEDEKETGEGGSIQSLPPGTLPPVSAANTFYQNQRIQPAPPVTNMMPPTLQPMPPVPPILRPPELGNRLLGPPFNRPNVPFMPQRLPIPSLPSGVQQAPLIRSNPPMPLPNPTTAYQNYPRKPEEKRPQVTTISKKPQLRNLSADATRFMPLALRVKRDDKQPANKKPPKSLVGYGMLNTSNYPSASTSKDQGNLKDDAYALFMKEMQDLV